MKKFILCAFFSCLLGFNMEAKKIKVVKKAGFFGYYWSVTSIIGPNLSTLYCTGPGFEKCQWDTGPQYALGFTGPVNSDDIVAWVEGQAPTTPIGNTIYGTTGIQVSWFYDPGEDELTIDITDVEP